MSVSNNHIIKKQVLEIHVPKHLEDTDVNEKTKEYLANHLYPELEKLFDELSGEDEIIRIDNITVDTGIYRKELISEEIITKTISAIKKQLVDKIQTARKSPSDSSVEIIKTTQTTEQIISHFFSTGTLPWWYKKDKKTLEELFYTLVEKNPDFISELVKKNTKNPNVSLRIINQFSEKSLLQIIDSVGVDVYIDIISSIPLEKRIKFSDKLKKVANLVFPQPQKHHIGIDKKKILYKNQSNIQQIIDRFLKTGLVDTLDETDAVEYDIEEVLSKLVDKKLVIKNQFNTNTDKIVLHLIKYGYTTTKVETSEIFIKIFGKLKAVKLLQNAKTVKQQQTLLKLHYQEIEKTLREDNARINILLSKIFDKKSYVEFNKIGLSPEQKTKIIKLYILKMEMPVLVAVENSITKNIPDNLKYLYTIAYNILGKQAADVVFQKNKSKEELIKNIQQLVKESTQKRSNSLIDIQKNINTKSIEISATVNPSNNNISNSFNISNKRNLQREYEKLQLLEHYLLTGVLPSISSNNQHDKIEKLFYHFIKKEGETTVNNIWDLLSEPISLKRVVYTFSFELLDKLLVRIEPSNANFIKNTMKDFCEILGDKVDSSVSFNTIRSVLYLIVFQFLIQNKGKTFKKDDFLKHLLEQTAIKFRKESKNWHKLIATQVLQDTKKKYSSEFKKYLQSIDVTISEQNNSQVDHRDTVQTHEQDKEGYYIENAGLVILHPYLPTMFRNLKLVEKNEFVSEEARERAVLLLQYIVTKEEVVPEHQLVLNKIICGMDITNPVPLHIDITPEEKTETEEIIKAAVEYWPAIKNTSVEGFRNSFLWREGMIRKEEDKWVIRVERKTYDMLLDKLPWGLSMIKFPWRKDIIYTQW